MEIRLSERQQETIAAATTILAAAVIVLAIGLLLWLLASFAARFSNVFLPLAVAAVAALVFKPYFKWLRERLHLHRVVALVAIFLSMIVPLGAFAWFFGAMIVSQTNELVRQLPEAIESIRDTVRTQLPEVVAFIEKYNLQGALDEAVEGGRARLVTGLQAVGSGAVSAGAGLATAAGILLSWIVLPVYFAFFLLAEARPLADTGRYMPFLKSETRADVTYLVDQFVDIVVAFFRGQLIIALLQGLLFAIGFTVVGLRYGFIIGLILGFLNIIPYLGNIVGLGTALPLAFFQPGGGLGRVLAVLVVFAVVQTIEGYILTPRIMGKRTGLHPMVIIVAIFFWGSALGGIMGMILAIPLTAFLVVFWRLAREKYVRELV